MVELSGIVGIPFLKKSRFTGSDKEKSFAMEKRSVEDEMRLAAIIWRGPICCDMTPDEKKQMEFFDFTEEGILRAVEWINSQSV